MASPIEDIRRGIELILSNTGVEEPKLVIPNWAREAYGWPAVMSLEQVREIDRKLWNMMTPEQRQRSLERVMEAVRMAPSGSNKQPWKFIIVTDPEVKMKLQKVCKNQPFINQAPAAIVACGYDVSYNRGGYMGDMTFLVDVSIAFTHLILAARAEGLGTCWLGDFVNVDVKDLLDIPDDWDVVAVTPIGYPKGEVFKETERRKQMSEIKSIGKF